MDTLASHVEIGVLVQALGAFLRVSEGITPGKHFEIVYAKSCNLVHFGPENVLQCCP